MKKNSSATKGSVSEPHTEVTVGTRTSIEVKPAITEAALLVLLEKVFGVVLNHPSINRYEFLFCFILFVCLFIYNFILVSVADFSSVTLLNIVYLKL